MRETAGISSFQNSLCSVNVVVLPALNLAAFLKASVSTIEAYWFGESGFNDVESFRVELCCDGDAIVFKTN